MLSIATQIFHGCPPRVINKKGHERPQHMRPNGGGIVTSTIHAAQNHLRQLLPNVRTNTSITSSTLRVQSQTELPTPTRKNSSASTDKTTEPQANRRRIEHKTKTAKQSPATSSEQTELNQDATTETKSAGRQPDIEGCRRPSNFKG